jgi:probable HAF family extracellular repeat protein
MEIAMKLNRSVVVGAALLALPAVAAAQTTRRYHVVKLAEIPAPSGCVPTAINDKGDVVGYCDAGGTTSFAVVWRGGAVEDLGRWASGTFTHGWGINSAGVVVGDGDDGNFDPKALLRGATAWIPLDLSGGSAQAAYGVTDDGVIFGNYTTQRHPGTETWSPVYWTYDAAHDRYDRHDLPKPPGTISGAFVFAATTLGTAVGEIASDLVGNQAGMWLNDASHALVVLDRPAGFASGSALGVSGDGRAAGYASNIAGTHAVLWQNDTAHTAIDLGTLPDDTDAQASGVNTSGQVVGTSFSPVSTLARTARGFLFADGGLNDLAALIDVADGPWTIDQAIGINNAGQIIAVGTQNGQRVPLLLNPVTAGCAAISVSASTAPGTVGQSFSGAVSAAGGMGPYAYVVSAGALPAGVSVSSEGAISGTPAAAGDFTVTITASDTLTCNGSVTITIHVAKAPQAITFAALPDRTFGDAAFAVSATGGASTSAVTFGASGTCSIAGNVVNIDGAGSCTVTAAEDGDANYEPAAPVAQTFSIAKATPLIAWPTPAEITFGTALSNVQLNATANVPGAFVYTPPTGFMPPPGTMVLTALFTPADAANYITASANVLLTVVGVVPPDANPMWQPDDQINTAGDRVQLQIVAAVDLTSARFSARGLPPALKISSDTGLICGTIKKRSEGVYVTTITLTVNGQTFSRTFTWTVK